MASSQKRRHSINLPPDLSDLTKELIDLASSFIGSFNDKEPRMREIVEEFKKIANKVRKMHQRTNVVRTGGAVVGAVTLGFAILAAPLTVGLSLAAAAAAAVVIGANITKSLKENGSAKQVKDLGEEFMKIIEPMKNVMEAIKKTCEKQKSAEVQAERTLSDLQELESILRQVSELGRRSQEVLDLTVILLETMNELVTLIISIFRVTATPEEDRKLTESIIQAADQSDKVINEFIEMRKELLRAQSKSLKF